MKPSAISLFLRAFTLLLAALILFTGCLSNEKKKASRLLKEAQEAVTAKRYTDAIALLDSIDEHYPGELKVRRSALDLGRELHELQNAARLDSIPTLLTAIEQRIDSLKKLVAVSEDLSEYGSPECFSSAQRSREKAWGILLLLRTDTLGFPSFQVIYNGNKPLQINSIALRSADSTANSSTILHDQSLNYRALVNGRHYEALTIPPNDSRVLVEFLLSLPEGNKPDLLLYRNHQKVTTQSISETRLAELRHVAQLSVLFAERYKLLQERQRRSMRLEPIHPDSTTFS